MVAAPPTRPGQLVVLTGADVADGFRLAGAQTLTAASAADAEALLRDILDAGDPGVVAVDQCLLDLIEPELRAALEGAAQPLLVVLPSGQGEHGASERRALLTELLQRAIGYHITFRGTSQ